MLPEKAKQKLIRQKDPRAKKFRKLFRARMLARLNEFEEKENDQI